MTRTVDDVRSVDHACVIPVSDEQLWEMTAEWLGAGLTAGERVLYFEDGTADSVLERLADDRVEVADAIADGQFTIVPTEQTRAALQAPPAELVAVLTSQIDDATDAGWPAVRLSGQVHSKVHTGLADVLRYEQLMDRALGDRPHARLLCLYDRIRYPAEAIEQLRAEHRTEVVRRAVYDDNLLRITTTGPCTARLAGEVDHSNRQRIRRLLDTTLDQALRSHSSPTDITLDLSSLRFVDVAGVVSLVHAAEEFPSSHQLVLTGVRPGLLRVLDRCGAPFAAQLRIEPRAVETRAAETWTGDGR